MTPGWGVGGWDRSPSAETPPHRLWVLGQVLRVSEQTTQSQRVGRAAGGQPCEPGLWAGPWAAVLPEVLPSVGPWTLVVRDYKPLFGGSPEPAGLTPPRPALCSACFGARQMLLRLCTRVSTWGTSLQLRFCSEDELPCFSSHLPPLPWGVRGGDRTGACFRARGSRAALSLVWGGRPACEGQPAEVTQNPQPPAASRVSAPFLGEEMKGGGFCDSAFRK